jgi:hypothetical protein
MKRLAVISTVFLSLIAVSPEIEAQTRVKPKATPIPIAKPVKKKLETEVVTPSEVTTTEATVTTIPLATPVPAATPLVIPNQSTPAPTPASPTPAPDSMPSRQTMQDRAKEATAKLGAVMNRSNEHRAESSFTVMGEYAPIDLILPSKVGGSVGWNYGDEATFELEYLGAKLSVPFIVEDLGSFKDQRISLVKRSFQGRNSLNFHYGLSYFNTQISVGNEYLASASNLPASLDLIGVKSLGFIWGVGNRWNFNRGFTVGVDWFSWAQPILIIDRDRELLDYIQDEGARDTLDEALRLSAYFPRFTVLKVQIGWSF